MSAASSLGYGGIASQTAPRRRVLTPGATYDSAVGLLDRFEDRLDRLVNGAFARAFKSEVQPVELAAALQKEMDDRAAVVSRGRTVVPNVFTIDLSPHDDERLSVYRDTLQTELATVVTEYAAEQSYALTGPAEVRLELDESLETGIFRVHSEARAAVVSSAASGAVPGQPYLEVGGAAYPLVRAVSRIGRGSDADIRVEDPGVSRMHCEIVLGSPAIARDLGSTNGTTIDGSRVQQAALVDGSTITVGTTTLVFRTPPAVSGG